MTAKTTRRKFLKTALAGGAGAGVAAALPARADDYITPAMTNPGKPFSGYGMPSPHEADVKRLLRPPGISPGTGGSDTPLEQLEGIITPNGLHYERHHNGVPDIDPATHKLLIHGLVNKPLEFSMDALMRYPRHSAMHFLECGGNSGALGGPQPVQASVGTIHGLLSCAEWTGVKLGLLLDEAGVQPEGKWILAESGDAASLSRSIPLTEAHEQGIIAMFQNGERIRPEQGYPVRLFMPGWEGNLNIKWLQRLKLVREPAFTREETSKYTQLQRDGIARQFDFIMPVKSVILVPSVGMSVQPGYQQITGLAWSGHGAIDSVEITVDGGQTWQKAELSGPLLPQCLTRFRLDWMWGGTPVLLQSRAVDSLGNQQPHHAEWTARFAPGQGYHYNGIQSWQIDAGGKVRNVHA